MNISSLSFAILLCFLGVEDDFPVEVFEMSPTIHYDGIVADGKGNLYAAEGYRGTRVFKVSSEGKTEVIAEGLKGPVDIAIDSFGNLLVSNFGSDEISLISPEGDVETFAHLKQGPSGVAIDSEDNLYVSIFGTGWGTDDEVWKVSPDGNAVPWVEGCGVEAPIGIARDDKDRIYVANWRNGKVFRIEGRNDVTHLTTVEKPARAMAIGHLEWGSGGLYASSGRKVFRINQSGAKTVLVDGENLKGEVASTFRNVNGLAASHDGRFLFVGGQVIPKVRRTIRVTLRE